ncbi:ribonuclease HII [Allofranklinella schreckenbergeri]|uniref:Ribonuclease HII n=1 Tax=Allofranklinella schreckenbergeri TaxID=1076744 RepID=A0A3M6QAU2_9BURK|nr:ribonuclease HII [Allofranklinella schreckenbergeri]RMW95482.1 ribonuclease HII [Allofranklinella schreckenbergeri]RMX00278.1 ribonuclease HII [Allofranklinella schreckenbergeri]
MLSRKAASSAAQKAAQKTARQQGELPLLLEALPPLLAGVDEAGRGPLAGPVVAAAVILDDLHPIAGLDDSKRLSAKKRQQLSDAIKAHALTFCIAEASVEEIDRLNILQATMLAMQRAVAGLRIRPRLVCVDGNRTPRLEVPAVAIVGGDAKVQAISAASILAKVHRDAWLDQADQQHPQYGFARHKGYGTAAHLAALQAHGPCALHRRSFRPVAESVTRWAEESGALPPVNAS